jgi:exodeoxyribonuclease V gamma subunit
VELDGLIRYFANPAAAFLADRLGIRLIGDSEVLEDQEIFDPDALERYGLRGDLLSSVLRGEGAQSTVPLLRAQGRLPQGAIGDLVVQEQADAADAFGARVLARLPPAHPPESPIELDLPVRPYRLRGWLRRPFDGGLITYRFGKLRAKDRLSVWVRHLALCRLTGDEGIRSTHVAEDCTLTLGFVPEAEALLLDLIELRLRGLRAPLCFFPETSLAWAEKSGFSAKLWGKWGGQENPVAESRDPAVAIAWRGREPLASPDFVELAQRIWRPMLAVSALVKAADDS